MEMKPDMTVMMRRRLKRGPSSWTVCGNGACIHANQWQLGFTDWSQSDVLIPKQETRCWVFALKWVRLKLLPEGTLRSQCIMSLNKLLYVNQHSCCLLPFLKRQPLFGSHQIKPTNKQGFYFLLSHLQSVHDRIGCSFNASLKIFSMINLINIIGKQVDC